MEEDSLFWTVEEAQVALRLTAKKMFGGTAYYKGSLLLWVTADGEPPFNGVLFPTEKSHHESLKTDFPGLESHSFLKKWVFACRDSDGFETLCRALCEAVIDRDPRIGVQGKKKKKDENF